MPGAQEFSLAVNGSLPEMVKLLRARFLPVECAGGRIRLTDPDGNRIGLVEGRPELPAACAGIAGLALPVRDLEACAHFYRRLGALSAGEPGKGGDTLAGGFLRLLPDTGVPVGAGDFCLIADMPIGKAYSFCANEARLAPETGIVQRTGALGPIRSFYLRDPEGNLVEIAAYRPD